MFVRRDTWLRLIPGAVLLVILPCLAVSQETTPPDRAILVFRLPANAKLMIGEGETTQSGSVRTFITPKLPKTGKGFSYAVMATWTENGKEKKVERVVRFKAGSRVEQDLTAPEKVKEKPKEKVKPKEPDIPRHSDTSVKPERLKLPTEVKEPESP